MSRHTARSATKPKLSLDYGYDEPLQHFFFTVLRGPKVIDSDEMSGCGARTLLAKADEYGMALPAEHRAALMLDLPV